VETRRPQIVEEAFDETLTRLMRGDSIDACLSAYPELASQLRPLLEVAERLHQLAGKRRVPAARLAAGRGRLLRQAALGRAGGRPSGVLGRLRRAPQQLGAFLAPLLRRSVASTVVVAALVVVFLAGTTMMASASSLPGDTLYPVKRAAESVHLALTFSEESKASVRQAMDQRRIQEARAVLERQRETRVSFRAIVESYDGSILVASGLTVHVLPTTALVGSEPSPGRIVHVVALSQPGQVLIAQRVETLEPTKVPQWAARRTATSAASPTATARPVTWQEPTVTQSPMVTETATLEPTPGLTVTLAEPISPTVAITATVDSTVTPTAAVTVTLVPTVTATPTPTLTPTPTRPVVIRLDGIVEELAEDTWRVAGCQIRITDTTQIDESTASAEVGAWVRVTAAQEPEGGLVAQKIVVERAAGEAGTMVGLEGIIESLGEAEWTVSGQPIEIGPATDISGDPSIGSLAVVEAWCQPDGALLATRINVITTEDPALEFTGPIEEIAYERWLIGGRAVRLNAQTIVMGNPVIGWQAQVWGIEESGGGLLALSIRVQASATPTPSPSPTLTPTARAGRTATSTRTPTRTATPTPTPTRH
jgi:hypothetical protein